MGAERDRIVDEAGIKEMATFLDVKHVMLPTVPHEVSLREWAVPSLLSFVRLDHIPFDSRPGIARLPFGDQSVFMPAHGSFVWHPISWGLGKICGRALFLLAVFSHHAIKTVLFSFSNTATNSDRLASIPAPLSLVCPT